MFKLRCTVNKICGTRPVISFFWASGFLPWKMDVLVYNSVAIYEG